MYFLADFLIVLVTLVPIPKKPLEVKRFTDQTSEAFQKTFDALHPQGWRLKRIHGHAKDGESRYDSDWHKPANPPGFWSSHGIDRDEYAALAVKLRKGGFVEVQKNVWKVNDMERIWTVWEKK